MNYPGASSGVSNGKVKTKKIESKPKRASGNSTQEIKKNLESFAIERLKPPPLLRGNDLINFGMKPGPLFGTNLDEIYDLQLEEKIKTRDEALAVVKGKWVDKR